MSHQVYENIILSNKVNDILTTKIDMNNYLTIDTSTNVQSRSGCSNSFNTARVHLTPDTLPKRRHCEI